jgi:NADPH:quinone reductase-like Zn-dependent oxidoreductase
MTAVQAIHLVGEYSPTKVRSILWHAGASAVSIAGIQLSLALSSPPPKVYATTRQDAKCKFVVDNLGAHAAFNATKSYAKADGSPGGTWADEVRRANGGDGVDLVIDFVGAPYFADNLSVLARDGRVVQLGVMGGTVLPAGVDISAFVMKRATFVGSTLRSRDPEYQGKLRDLFAETVLPGLIKGELSMPVEKVVSWWEIEAAHRLLEENGTMGKVVCLVD